MRKVEGSGKHRSQCHYPLTDHAAAHDEGVVYGGHGVEVLGGAERGQRAVAGGGQPDGGAVLPVLAQHHAPVRALVMALYYLQLGQTISSVYPVGAAPAHGSVGPLRHAVGEGAEVCLPLDGAPVAPHMLSWHKPRHVDNRYVDISR